MNKPELSNIINDSVLVIVVLFVYLGKVTCVLVTLLTLTDSGESELHELLL